jgi:hypothetical protein
MHPRGGGRCVHACIAGLVLSLAAAVEASAVEWEQLRESYDRALGAQARRIAEIEAREPGLQAAAAKRAEKITRDRISGLRGSSKTGGKARDLADAAERASRDRGGLAEMSRAHEVHVDIATREWGADGSERKALRESVARGQRSLERANANLASAAEIAATTAAIIPDSGAAERVARIEAELKLAGERLRARWQNQQAALERERIARERAAAERERSLR